MQDLQIFNSPEFGQIRTIERDGDPWFVGKDVAAALGYSDTKSALTDHVDSEDKQIIQRGANRHLRHPKQGIDHHQRIRPIQPGAVLEAAGGKAV